MKHWNECMCVHQTARHSERNCLCSCHQRRRQEAARAGWATRRRKAKAAR